MTTQPLKGIIKEEPKNGLLDLLIFTLQMILLLTMIVPWNCIGQKLDLFFNSDCVESKIVLEKAVNFFF